jgi:hypothetical protein
MLFGVAGYLIADGFVALAMPFDPVAIAVVSAFLHRL